MIAVTRASMSRILHRLQARKLVGSFGSKFGAFSTVDASVPRSPTRMTLQSHQFSIEGLLEETESVVDVRSLLPPDYTPGHVMAVLNRVGKGGAEISEENFRLLVDCARPYESKDAKVIMTAMVNYKRISRFLLTEQLASDCIDQILSSDARGGGLLVLENFTIESGLYYAAPVHALHKALNRVLETEDEPDRVWNALVPFLQKLIMRRQRPHRQYKKRAARKYLKQIQTHEGPNAETVALCVELALSVKDDARVVYNEVVQPCLDARVDVDDEVLLSLQRKIAFLESEENDETDQVTTTKL